MSEFHERFIDGLCEARWQAGARPEFHKGENKQSYRAEEQRSEADKLKQIKIEFLNMPILALEMPGSKRADQLDSKNLETRTSFVDVIAMILKMIVDGAKAIFPKRKEKS